MDHIFGSKQPENINVIRNGKQCCENTEHPSQMWSDGHFAAPSGIGKDLQNWWILTAWYTDATEGRHLFQYIKTIIPSFLSVTASGDCSSWQFKFLPRAVRTKHNIPIWKHYLHYKRFRKEIYWWKVDPHHNEPVMRSFDVFFVIRLLPISFKITSPATRQFVLF